MARSVERNRQALALPAGRRGGASIRSYGDARQCDTSGCTTVLSRYNEATLCWVHASSSIAKARARTADR